MSKRGGEEERGEVGERKRVGRCVREEERAWDDGLEPEHWPL